MLGETIKRIRKEHGDSLRTLASKLGITFTYIDRIEKGINTISVPVFKKLLTAYPLERNILIKEYADEYIPSEIKEVIGLKIETDFVDNIFSIIKNLDVDTKKIILMGVIEKLEYVSLKNGTYELVKNILEEAKNKTESLK